MNEKEIAEIRRHFHPEKSNISNIRGCYVNEKQEIIAEFTQSVALMPEDETEKFLAVLKRTLSGSLEKNLFNMEFSTRQVVESEEHKLLMALRDSSLHDDAAVQAFFNLVIGSVVIEGNYLILLAQDVYDVPYRSPEGEQQEDAATDVFSYIVCSICPVKMTKPALSYFIHENEFHSRTLERIVSPPELGFLFPAFDGRATNIYGALYYSRDTTEAHSEFVEAVFQSEAPMPPAAQKETFGTVLGEALTSDSSYEVIQAVHGQLQDMIEEHKANKEAEPLRVSKTAVKRMLESEGVPVNAVSAFDERFDSEFGAETDLPPQNIVNPKLLELATPDVTIRVSAQRSDLIETRVIDGAKYILVRAEEGATLNGVPIFIS